VDVEQVRTRDANGEPSPRGGKDDPGLGQHPPWQARGLGSSVSEGVAQQPLAVVARRKVEEELAAS
jgi:hypothetical protein